MTVAAARSCRFGWFACSTALVAFWAPDLNFGIDIMYGCCHPAKSTRDDQKRQTEMDTHADAYFKAHFEDCPSRLQREIDQFTKHPKTILDFGCGHGAKTLALALRYPNAEVVGVDVTSAFENHAKITGKYLAGQMPENVTFRQIHPGQSLADLVRPDVIVSWSVLEHVARAILQPVIEGMAAALNRNGIVVTQIAPLFHSPYGSHLRQFVDEPWAHLLLSHDMFRQRVAPTATPDPPSAGSAAWMFARFEELNRITAPELFRYFQAAGLAPLKEDTRAVATPPPEELLFTYSRDALTTFELLSVHRKG